MMKYYSYVIVLGFVILVILSAADAVWRAFF